MRLVPLAIALVSIASPIQAVAKPKPKIAIAPLTGDSGNKVAQAVVDALAGKDFVVVGPRDTKRELTRLGAPDELGPKDVRKLTAKLEAVAIIDGTVTKASKKRMLHLEIHRRGKPASGFSVEFKSATSDGFRRGVHDEVVKKLEGATEDTDDDDDAKRVAAKQAEDDKRKPADDDAPKRKLSDDDPPKRKLSDDDAPKRKLSDDDAPKRKLSDDDPPKRKPADDDAPKRKLADDDAPKRAKNRDDAPKRKRVADDEPAVRKRKTHKLEDDEPAPQLLARVGAGASLAQRRLSYDTRPGFTQIPPGVITTAGAGRVDGEIYPFALADAHSSVAGLGLAASYDKTFGLSIKVPNKPVSAPINQSRYAFGARYRFGVGDASSIALGLDYFGRSYVADRSGLMNAVLDTPDFQYSAVAPGIAARTPVTPTITLFGGLDGLLMLDTGPVTKTASYGPATVYGVEVLGGVDIALAKQIALRIAAEYSQINFSFSATGALASGRDNDKTTQDVMGAVDRSIGVAATLGLVY